MRMTIGTWMCVVLCVCCVTGAASAMVQAESDPYAGCMVKITADPAVYPLTIDNIGYLIRRTGVGQKAINDVLKTNVPADDAITVEALEPVGGAADPYSGYGAAGAPMVGMYMGGREMGMMGAGFGWGGPGAPGGGGFGGSTADTGQEPSAADPTDKSDMSPPASVAARYGMSRSTRAGTGIEVERRINMETIMSRGRGTRAGTGMGGYGAMGGMGGYGGGYGGYVGASPYGAGQPVSTGETGAVTLFIHLAVDLRAWPEAPGTAKETLQAVIENLRHALEDASLQYQEAVDRQARVVEEEALRAEKELIELQASLRDLSGSRDLSRQSVHEDLRGLRSYLETSVRERATNSATAEAMGKQLANSRAQLENEMGADAILHELERMVKMAEEQEAQVQKMVQTGRAGASETAQAAEKTLRTRIELAKRKEELANAAGGGQAALLNGELANLSVKAAQLDAEIAYLEQQATEARALLEKADAHERELVKLDLARRNLEEALVLRDRMARRFRMIVPPAVVVMGAE